jgi:hypothetical protein
MNVYQAFQALIPRASQIVATVQIEHSDGTTSGLTLDNQSIRVRGVGGRVSGARVFIEIDPVLGGSITGPAPELPGYAVEV